MSKNIKSKSKPISSKSNLTKSLNLNQFKPINLTWLILIEPTKVAV